MTSAAELVARLRDRGVSLKPDGDHLIVRPAGAVTAAEVAELLAHKAEVLRMLDPGVCRPLERIREGRAVVDMVGDYIAVLGKLWHQNVPDEAVRSRPAQTADLGDVDSLLAEQARTCDDLGPEFAAAISRQASRAWARSMRRCPFCGLPDVYHDPDT